MDALNTHQPAAEPAVSPIINAGSANAQGTLAQQIARLQQLSLGELRVEWRRLFRAQPPNLSRDLITRSVAYRLQEVAYGGLPKATLRKLMSLADELKAEGQISVDAGPQIKPGARLIREWRGRTHIVTVTEDGFEYAGRAYSSLTKIARAITGACWSGPRFFGLTKPNELVVERLDDGEVSPYFHHVAELGDVIEIRAPSAGTSLGATRTAGRCSSSEAVPAWHR
jgi:Protein of unknown function (DUF2924)